MHINKALSQRKVLLFLFQCWNHLKIEKNPSNYYSIRSEWLARESANNWLKNDVCSLFLRLKSGWDRYILFFFYSAIFFLKKHYTLDDCFAIELVCTWPSKSVVRLFNCFVVKVGFKVFFFIWIKLINKKKWTFNSCE